MTVLVVSNQKGGVGKTTTAISLGAAMVERGQRVLIVDLDPQANATSGLGISKERANGIYGVLLRERPLAEAVVPTAVAGLDLLPSGPEMAGAEVELVPVMAREYRLRKALRDAVGYDTVIVDCPPSLGLLTVNALAAGDGVVVPVQCEYYALEGLAQLLESVERIRGALNPGLALTGLLLTMYDRRTRLSGDVEREVRTHFGPKVFSSVVPRSVRLAEAPSHGLPITQYDPNSRSADAYYRLALEVVERG